MKKVIVACSLAIVAVGLGLAGSAIADPAVNNFKVIHPAELATLISANHPSLVIYDVNTQDFRAKEGIIPGAKLLSSSNRYDVAKELPAAKDATLVFYCANTH